MRSHLSSFVDHLRARHAARTALAYAAAAGRFVAFVGDRAEGVTRADVERFLDRPRSDGAPRSAATVNQELAALRSFAMYLAAREGPLLPVNEILFRKEPARDPAVLTAAEVGRLFRAAASESDATRRACHLALVALLAQLGLRVHEVVRLDLDQVDLENAILVSVHGKGATVHDIPMNSPVVALLRAWIEERSKLAAPGERALFVSSRGTRLSGRSVERLFVKLRERMGTKKRMTPHTGRHSVATLALAQGTDLLSVSELLRHSSINATKRYIHLVDERRRAALSRLAVVVPREVLPPGNDVSPQLATIDSHRENRTSEAPGTLDDQQTLCDIDQAA